MPLVHRVLYPRPILSLDEYVARGGGKGLLAARKLDPKAIRQKVMDAGLRGRGGAGFPTGVKWQTVAENQIPGHPASVIVNAAEGEPGTFKDRTILRRNPYLVLEGALIAALAVGADLIVFATKRSFAGEVDRLQGAADEADAAGWTRDVKLVVFEGPDEYLYGEESALLDTIDGGWPFPRIVPTFRRGLEIAGDDDSPPPPALVNNTETLANVARIVARGPKWFRTVGTDDSPGTMVCTISGYTQRAGVGEVPMGTPLREVIDEIGGGPRRGHRIKAVLSGVANAVITADDLDAPVSYEGMRSIGSGLGSGGFIVLDDTVDMAAVAAGVARFLAVESCGQCLPCKLDGITLGQELVKISASVGTEHNLRQAKRRLSTVADRARCFLASQQQVVVGSIVENFGDELQAHLRRAGGQARPVEPELIAELVDIRGDEALLDERHRLKQPDWTYNSDYSGTVPVERYAKVRPPWVM
jgi:NADH:ubiquinone oxidoreductase subunit F (NADH-binding)